jgi:hypothetical protein
MWQRGTRSGWIAGRALSRADLTTACGAHTQGKKRSVEAHASEDGSGEMVVVHAGGFCGGMVMVLGVGSHR